MQTEDALKTNLRVAPPVLPVSSRDQRRLRRLALLLAILAFVCLAALAVVGWLFSSRALTVTPGRLHYSDRVLAVRGHTVTITESQNTVRQGTYRLQWRGGQVILGQAISRSSGGVTRRIEGRVHGLKVGMPVHFDSYIYDTPASLGLRYRTVEIPGPLGAMPAWFIPGKRRTWVIVAHGRGSPRQEALRPTVTLATLGLPVLAVTYRNDIGAPASPDHLYHLGATEWQDLQADVRYALTHGARDVILYGFSYGGAVVESFMHRSLYAAKVRAVVLDSPVLDWAAVFKYEAPGYLPGPVADWGEKIVEMRIGLSSLDQTVDLLPDDNYMVPTLFFQGTADTLVPPGENMALARMRPAQVTLVVFPGAEHTQEWNNNPVRYSTALRRFLERVLRY